MSNKVYYIPSGPKNLQTLFPDIDWNLVDDYYVEVFSDATKIATTPLMNIGCCCGLDTVTIHFLNYLGTYDSITFSKPTIKHPIGFETYKKSLSDPLVKTDTGSERFNITANDIYTTFTNCYGEKDKEWMKELFDSPKAFMQWTGTEDQQDSYLPIVIISNNFDAQKSQEEWFYKTTIEFKLSNEVISIRN